LGRPATGSIDPAPQLGWSAIGQTIDTFHPQLVKNVVHPGHVVIRDQRTRAGGESSKGEEYREQEDDDCRNDADSGQKATRYAASRGQGY
jgi:hypothetical protein